jgi:hypothetical protein
MYLVLRFPFQVFPDRRYPHLVHLLLVPKHVTCPSSVFHVLFFPFCTNRPFMSLVRHPRFTVYCFDSGALTLSTSPARHVTHPLCDPAAPLVAVLPPPRLPDASLTLPAIRRPRSSRLSRHLACPTRHSPSLRSGGPVRRGSPSTSPARRVTHSPSDPPAPLLAVVSPPRLPEAPSDARSRPPVRPSPHHSVFPFPPAVSLPSLAAISILRWVSFFLSKV